MSDSQPASRRPTDRYGYLQAPEARRRRGRRIGEALAEFGGVDIATATILDVGCSTGLITDEIAQTADRVIGVDVDVDSLAYAAGHASRARFIAASADRLPFADASFDAVVCNHVYEHVPDASALMREAHRVLRAGGACYFAGGHTLQIVEPHYRVPFLSWLPRPIASRVLRATRRGARYDERFVPPWRLRALFTPFADATFISARMLAEPERFGLPGAARLPSRARRWLSAFGGAAARLAPTWIYMLRK
jgi:2-polyprenyl-3-methyl-5-hydroxy-6-metoxy-1,4-benzoquinol methylase